MKRLALALCLAACLWSAEPIAGNWLLKSQQVAGQEIASRPLLLRISQAGDGLAFEYSVAVNQKQEVSLRFTARLDGTEADVTNSTGRKIGTAKVTRAGAGQYLVTLLGPGRPASSGKMTVDGKKLVSESDSVAPGGAKTHTVQVFERQ